MCHFRGRSCFEKAMIKSSTVDVCNDCPNDCSGISYHYNIIVKDTDINEVCVKHGVLLNRFD